MHRRPLLQQLSHYAASDDHERRSLRRIVAFVESEPRCFERACLVGHITASAWVLDATRRRVLLTHHRKLGRWLQLGGHADGNPDVAAVALQEAREESGLPRLALLDEAVFDVDVHTIPEHGGAAAHEHFDVRFLIGAEGPGQPRCGLESLELAWWTPDQLAGLQTDASVRRMARKWLGRAFDNGLEHNQGR